jgi:UDP-3-O-[3-hydroxymyristoyl] glucosamine N-acyltransferase
MQATLAELAALVQGEVIGEGDALISGASPLDQAKPGEITMIDKAERAHLLGKSQASAVVAPKGVTATCLPTIQVSDIHKAFSAIISHFRPPRVSLRIGISPLAVISPKAKLGRDVDVYPFCTIGDDVEIGEGSTIHAGVHIMAGVKIGPQVTIYPNAVIYEDSIIGPRCVIHAGAVIGAYGFGYGFDEGRHRLAAQLGNVILGEDVEIGANSTVDRGTYGSTIIGEGTKIDNQVMVAHNCHIGKHNLLCAQVGIAGSTTTGDYVVMAGQVGVRDHVHIGTQAVLGAMAGVINDIPEGARVVGIPATPEREQMIKQAALAKLPEMRRQLKQLQATVDRLVHAEGLAKQNGKGVGVGE